MIEFEIPGRGEVRIERVALDFNGTIACDGRLIEGVVERLAQISRLADVFVLTADTYGTVREQCEPLGVEIRTFPREGAAVFKSQIVRDLGGRGTACVGNGFNDIQMFDEAGLSIAVVEAEGACAALLSHADIVTRSAVDALDLLLKTDRIRATLRS
jgi:P-type E1-E2 ATPase